MGIINDLLGNKEPTTTEESKEYEDMLCMTCKAKSHESKKATGFKRKALIVSKTKKLNSRTNKEMLVIKGVCTVCGGKTCLLKYA